MPSASRQITNGPSKFDLMSALFVEDADQRQILSSFSLERVQHRVQINSVTRRGLTDWRIAGIVELPGRSFGQEATTWRPFVGNYSTKNRQGSITID